MESKKVFLWIEIFLLSGALILSVLLKDFFLLIPLAILLALSVFYLKVFLQIVSRPKFWILVISPVIISAFFAGERNLSISFLKVSSSGALIGINMAARAMCMILSFAFIFSRVSFSALIRFFQAKGLKGLGLSIGVAYNMLFTLVRTGRVVFETLRLRGVVRRHPLRALRLFVVALISSTLQHADEIVNAATVRAFDTRM